MSMNPVPLSAPCPVCGHAGAAPVLHKNGYTLARCGACDALHVNPVPSDAELQAHYQNPEYFAGENGQGYQNYADMEKALIPHFKRRLGVIQAHLPARGRLLDFGCAAGYFLKLAQAEGWQIEGVELSRDMADTAARDLGRPIANSLEDLPDRPFDAVTLWEVIEHLPRPVEQLQALRSRLRPGGVLMLSTPNTGHWQALHEPEAWEGYRPPSHLLFFTAHTLTETLRRAGFTRMAIRGVAPLPPLPGWLRHASAPLQHGLSTGQAKFWRASRLAWRGIRLLGWAWQRLAHPDYDIFATLEAVAFRPA